MIFSSITFLYAFFPLTLILYFIAPQKAKNAVLLLASLVFYAFGEPVYVVLLLISSISDWLHSLYIEGHRGTRGAKIALISSIVINLGLLGFFKYADFFIGTVNSLTGLSIPLTGVALPIGISFYTFQTMSYTIDVYLGNAKAQKNFMSIATFVCLFPQLIAGPIVRYVDVMAELDNRKTRWQDMGIGIRRFVIGLGKKVLIANGVAELCSAYAATMENTVLFAWLYAVAFMLQIYFDFSGYSDMAIGLGRMFGFKFPENFNYPYLSKSITEFWRRWHMTLGTWFRDYVYIPLGGNRCSKGKWLRNIAVVWLLTGLWHGAAWNFVLWGVMFGALLMIEKLWLGKPLAKAPGILSRVYVLFIVLVSFVIFNAASIGDAFSVLGRMFGAGGAGLAGSESLYVLRSYAVMLVIAIVGATNLPKRLAEKFAGTRVMDVLEPVFMAVLLLLVTANLVDGSLNPFLYFRF